VKESCWSYWEILLLWCDILFCYRSLMYRGTKKDWLRSLMHRRRHLLCLKWPSMRAIIKHRSVIWCGKKTSVIWLKMNVISTCAYQSGQNPESCET